MTYKDTEEQVRAKVLSRVFADPGLPVPNPTTSYWQLPPHPSLANVQSASLAAITDFAIIGSGISGCSIAKNILEHPKSAGGSVTVFEARTLTSGATGRNAGSAASLAPFSFARLIERYGKDEAAEIARFTYDGLNKLHELGHSSPEILEASQMRRTREISSVQDEQIFKSMVENFKLMEEHVPEAGTQMEVFETERAQEAFGVAATHGAVRYNSGICWPYRLVTAVWEQLIRDFSSRLKIETHTAVTEITFDHENSEYPYIVTTPRGKVRAKKVVHAVNGYAGHLLPKLRNGTIYPMLGAVSSQKPGSKFGSYGWDRSWTFFSATDGIFSNNQNITKGDVICYGNPAEVTGQDMYLADDSYLPTVTVEAHEEKMPKLFPKAWQPGEKPVINNIWTGTMGWTTDRLPLVGELPASVTGRGGNGEFISAGFNGAGLSQCWTSGEAVVKLMFGEEVAGFLPKTYLVTEDRLSRITPDAVEKVVFGTGPNL